MKGVEKLISEVLYAGMAEIRFRNRSKDGLVFSLKAPATTATKATAAIVALQDRYVTNLVDTKMGSPEYYYLLNDLQDILSSKITDYVPSKFVSAEDSTKSEIMMPEPKKEPKAQLPQTMQMDPSWLPFLRVND